MNDSIVPDDKDWTWVLERRCPECGFDAGAVDVEAMGALIRANAAVWFGVLGGHGLGGDDTAVRTRTSPDRWSTLEYGAHVRDVFRLYLQRLSLMLHTDDPLYPNWDQDDASIASQYHLQNPSDVAVELRAAAEELADAFDGVDGESWQRVGRRSDGASFTVESFARYLIHDPVHHLWDVTGVD